jgi:hypothetical protein
MALCSLCHVMPADRRVECQGYALPYCSQQCASVMHRALLVGVKRKGEEEDDDSEGKRKRPNPLQEATDLLLQRFQEAMRRGQLDNIRENMERLRHAQETMAQQLAAQPGTPEYVLHPTADSWFYLPTDVRLIILSGISLMDLMKMRTTSPYVQRQVDQEPLWRHFCVQGPLARTLHCPPRLYLRSWRDQGLTLLRAHSYAVWRPHDPLRPMAWIPSMEEAAQGRCILEVRHDADKAPGGDHRATDNWQEELAKRGITQVAMDRGHLLQAMQSRPLLLQIWDRWVLFTPQMAQQHTGPRVFGQVQERWWKPGEATVQNPRYGHVFLPGQGHDAPLIVFADTEEIIHTLANRPKDLGFDQLPQEPANVIRVYRDGLRVIMYSAIHPPEEHHVLSIEFTYDSEYVLRVLNQDRHQVVGRRFLWKLASPAALDGMKTLRETRALTNQDWLDAPSDTLHTLHQAVGHSVDWLDRVPTGMDIRPGNYVLEITFHAVVALDTGRVFWVKDRNGIRLAPLHPADQQGPVPATDTYSPDLMFLVKEGYDNTFRQHPNIAVDGLTRIFHAVRDKGMLPAGTEVPPTFGSGTYEDSLMPPKTPMRRFSAPPGHEQLGLALLYQPSRRMLMLPLVSAPLDRPVLLTHGVEGIASHLQGK